MRILALKEQKRQRSAELSRLHRELKRVQREQQKATEVSLIKQIDVRLRCFHYLARNDCNT